jgi:hypothetical protein
MDQLGYWARTQLLIRYNISTYSSASLREEDCCTISEYQGDLAGLGAASYIL